MGWRYRLASIIGVGVLTGAAVFVANLHPVQAVFTTYTPVFWRLEPIVLTGSDLVLATTLSVLFVVFSLIPLYKPRPMRVLDAVFLSQRRVLIAGLALATLGYFNYSYRLPRATLTMTIGMLVVAVPIWFVWIRKRPRKAPDRTVVIGDDPEQVEKLVRSTDIEFLGQISPSLATSEFGDAMPDGGMQLPRLGGLSRTEDLLLDLDVDTAVLAFREPDRGDFFGALDTCYDHGVDVKVHRGFADSVLTADEGGGILVDVNVEPWDVQDYVAKRVFDVLFAGIGLLLLSPVIVAIAILIKLDDGGPILYRQQRTAGFGGPFVIHKFRTMREPKSEYEADADRITQLGKWLRGAHVDEIPQLWAIFVGRMSVVGPRPVWVEEENLIEMNLDGTSWRRRWFVKPGLTGLAQIADVGSERPAEKLRYDLEYIRRQSFFLDMQIVLRQVWKVMTDAVAFAFGTDRTP